MVFVYPLHPNACAEGMLAFGEAQVISQAEEFPDVAKRVDARRRRDGRRNDGGGAASDDNLSGITRGKKYQVCGDCRPSAVRLGDRGCIRTDPPQGRGIDHSGGEDMRFLHAERLGAQWKYVSFCGASLCPSLIV